MIIFTLDPSEGGLEKGFFGGAIIGCVVGSIPAASTILIFAGSRASTGKSRMRQTLTESMQGALNGLVWSLVGYESAQKTPTHCHQTATDWEKIIKRVTKNNLNGATIRTVEHVFVSCGFIKLFSHYSKSVAVVWQGLKPAIDHSIQTLHR